MQKNDLPTITRRRHFYSYYEFSSPNLRTQLYNTCDAYRRLVPVISSTTDRPRKRDVLRTKSVGIWHTGTGAIVVIEVAVGACGVLLV